MHVPFSPNSLLLGLILLQKGLVSGLAFLRLLSRFFSLVHWLDDFSLPFIICLHFILLPASLLVPWVGCLSFSHVPYLGLVSLFLSPLSTPLEGFFPESKQLIVFSKEV